MDTTTEDAVQGSDSAGSEQEAALMVALREGFKKSIQMSKANLEPRQFERNLMPLEGKLDVDATAIAADVVGSVVHRLEAGFDELCMRNGVNEKLLQVERAARRYQQEEEARENAKHMLLRPLPAGVNPADLLKRRKMKVKAAERERLLKLLKEEEALAAQEGAGVEGIEREIALRLKEVKDIRLEISQAASSLP
ncbi:unnamed protein product [Discosporangium mesarthrocarpum]